MRNWSDFFKRQGTIYSCDNYKIIILTERRFLVEEMDHLIDCVRIVAADGFGVDPEEKSRVGIERRLSKEYLVSIAYNDDMILGFASAMLYPGLNLLFVEGIAIVKVAQGHGIGVLMLELLHDASRLYRIALTTQNPVMYYGLSKIIGTIYPTIDSPTIPDYIRSLGSHLDSHCKGKLDSETFVVINFYSKCLYPQIPQLKNNLINDWFRYNLQIQDGQTRNAFLFIGE